MHSREVEVKVKVWVKVRLKLEVMNTKMPKVCFFLTGALSKIFKIFVLKWLY